MMTWTQTQCMKNENFFIEKCFLDLVREFEELKEGQSESEGGG